MPGWLCLPLSLAFSWFSEMHTNAPNKMSIDILRAAYVCDFEIGKIYHRHSKQGVRNNLLAGFTAKDGYRRIVCGKKSFAAHRVIWALYYGEWPSGIIDHIDCDKNNNAISNLRLASPSDNAANRRRRVGSSSRLKGVAWHKKCAKWQSQIRHGKTQYHLGLFDSEEEAHAAYVAKAKELFGIFARAV